MDYGELAVNYAKGQETILLKNNENNIIEFKSKDYIENTYYTKIETNNILSEYVSEDIVKQMIKEAIKRIDAGIIMANNTEEPENPEMETEGYVRKEHFDLNTAKANGDLNLITDLEDIYVQVEFNTNNQSYWLRSPSWTNTATSCKIHIEDLIVTDANGNVIDLPPYVGFYNRTYSQKIDQYRIVDNEEIIITENGSNKRGQFGSSSSYQSGQIFIKMKLKLKYV